MHDIVATIQAEQDRIIRSELRGALVVQGGPGTGKTAVALHRAAYLLYTHRERLRIAGVLIVGPSAAFLRYIEAVLPSLGETGVVLAVPRRAVPRRRGQPTTMRRGRRAQGPAEMADLIARAVQRRASACRREPAADRGERRHAHRAAAADRVARSTGPSRAASRTTWPGSPSSSTPSTRWPGSSRRSCASRRRRSTTPTWPMLREDLRASRRRAGALNTAWLPLTPREAAQDLYARPEWLAALTPRWTPEQRALLLPRPRRRRSPSPTSRCSTRPPSCSASQRRRRRAEARARSSSAKRDIENAEQAIRNMGVEGMVSAEAARRRLRRTRRAGDDGRAGGADRTWTYGHVVVDEAQELSPMQWRLLVRRSPMRSFTIVGDIAQASCGRGVAQLGGGPATLEPLRRPLAARGAHGELPHAGPDRRGRRVDRRPRTAADHPDAVGARGRLADQKPDRRPLNCGGGCRRIR